jgi:hypothetical protein
MPHQTREGSASSRKDFAPPHHLPTASLRPKEDRRTYGPLGRGTAPPRRFPAYSNDPLTPATQMQRFSHRGQGLRRLRARELRPIKTKPGKRAKASSVQAPASPRSADLRPEILADDLSSGGWGLRRPDFGALLSGGSLGQLSPPLPGARPELAVEIEKLARRLVVRPMKTKRVRLTASSGRPCPPRVRPPRAPMVTF